jgi:hypothetical protein
VSFPSVAEWALANPAARDALLALTDRAVALQPAAEAAIQRCQASPDEPAGLQDVHLVRDTYRSLRDHLHTLSLQAPVATQLADLLDHHLEALDRALGGTVAGGGGSGGLRPSPPEGLGPPAGRLVGLRDLLRRTVAVGGRPVSDVTPSV